MKLSKRLTRILSESKRAPGGRHDASHMAKMRSKLRYGDARDGRLKQQVRRVFVGSGGQPVTSTVLLENLYWKNRIDGKRPKSWQRGNVIKVAHQYATVIGRAKSRGRPFIWQPRPELLADPLGWRGLKRGPPKRP